MPPPLAGKGSQRGTNTPSGQLGHSQQTRRQGLHIRRSLDSMCVCDAPQGRPALWAKSDFRFVCLTG